VLALNAFILPARNDRRIFIAESDNTSRAILDTLTTLDASIFINDKVNHSFLLPMTMNSRPNSGLRSTMLKARFSASNKYIKEISSRALNPPEAEFLAAYFCIFRIFAKRFADMHESKGGELLKNGEIGLAWSMQV
jgi:hypothetical protein